MRLIFLLCGIAFLLPLSGQHGHIHDRPIHFPDVDGFLTLICDFHQHTVFSDGSVWPDIRVQEALRDSVDAISLTEHIEYQPHGADIPNPDRNRSYEIAEARARPYDLMVIRGAEITRSMPPGHNNAIFIEDANRLLIKDSLAVFEEANRQGAFVFWNHPDWSAQRMDGVARMTDFHQELIDKKLLHGIEVVNDLTISEEALQIALDQELVIIGTSDIHGLVDWQYRVAEGGHRPVTLVFAEERSQEAIKEAMFAGRTVAWYENTLVGREPEIQALLAASITVSRARYQGPKPILDVTIKNDSDAEFQLVNHSRFSFQNQIDMITLPPNAETVITVRTLKELKSLELVFDVMNVLTAPRTHPRFSLEIHPD